MKYKSRNYKSEFELESLEPRIMLAADAGASAVAPEVISETISTAEFDEINQRSDNLSYRSAPGSIFDFEEEKDELGEVEKSTEKAANASDRSDMVAEKSQVETNREFVFRSKADENDLLLRLNPDDSDRLQLLDQTSGITHLSQTWLSN